MVLAELLDLVEGQVIASQVQPRVDEHGAVARRQDETVTVDPLPLHRRFTQREAATRGQIKSER